MTVQQNPDTKRLMIDKIDVALGFMPDGSSTVKDKIFPSNFFVIFRRAHLPMRRFVFFTLLFFFLSAAQESSPPTKPDYSTQYFNEKLSNLTSIVTGTVP
ncbi:MAG: hypothetical protein ACK4I8_04450 [Armatimonadota bacterium]